VSRAAASRGRRPNAAVTLAAVAAALLAGCATARRSEPLRGPVTLDARSSRGQIVFMRNCNACHPGGEGGLAPAINNKPVPTFVKKFQVRHGLGAMPGFPSSKLSDSDLDDLMAYLKELRGHKAAADVRTASH
jgi:mono/diheme cytochrome c family protein